eukprot:6071775-Amphidinium_carterae.1
MTTPQGDSGFVIETLLVTSESVSNEHLPRPRTGDFGNLHIYTLQNLPQTLRTESKASDLQCPDPPRRNSASTDRSLLDPPRTRCSPTMRLACH